MKPLDLRPLDHDLMDEFPAIQMVRTGRLVRVIGRITFVALILSIIAMVFVPWRQTARGNGTVIALDPQERPQPVLSPSKGVIVFVKPDLREGSRVEEGDVLLRLEPIAAGGISLVDSQVVALQEKRATLVTQQSIAEDYFDGQIEAGEATLLQLEQDVKAKEEKLNQMISEFESIKAELEAQRNELRVDEKLNPRGIVSDVELVNKQQKVKATEQKARKAEQAVSEAQANLISKEKEVLSKIQDVNNKNREAELKIGEARQKINEVDKQISEVQVKQGENERLTVRAPKSGLIQKWDGRVGSDTVKEAEQLFVIVPDAEQLAVEMKVSGNDMPLIKEGDRVRLQFEGWPAVQFVGWPSVAVGTFGGKVNRVFPTDDGMGNFRVLVTADNHFAREDGWPEGRFLRQGVRANGWVLLKRVPLGYEIWRQLNGFPPVIDDPTGKGGFGKDDKGSKIKLPKP